MEPEPMNETVDAEAPFGRKVDGTPKRAPGGRPPKGTSGPNVGRRPVGKGGRRAGLPGFLGGDKTMPPPPPKSRPNKPSAAEETDYTEGIQSAVMLLAFPLRKVAPLDCAALLMGAPDIARAGNELAHEIPQVAEWCDRLLSHGPWTGLAMAVGSVAAQIAENHGWLPSIITRPFGALPRKVFESRIAAAEAAEAAAAATGTDYAERVRQAKETEAARVRAESEATGQWEPVYTVGDTIVVGTPVDPAPGSSTDPLAVDPLVGAA